MNCTNCSAKVSNNTYFCPKCGKLINIGILKIPEIIIEYEKKRNSISTNMGRWSLKGRDKKSVLQNRK